jgi:hypothetical protein
VTIDLPSPWDAPPDDPKRLRAWIIHYRIKVSELESMDTVLMDRLVETIENRIKENLNKRRVL